MNDETPKPAEPAKPADDFQLVAQVPVPQVKREVKPAKARPEQRALDL